MLNEIVGTNGDSNVVPVKKLKNNGRGSDQLTPSRSALFLGTRSLREQGVRYKSIGGPNGLNIPPNYLRLM